MSEQNKATVRRLDEEVLNGANLELIDELYAPELAGAAKRWITPFRASFPDVHMEIVELIAEGDKSSAASPAQPLTWAHGSATRRLGVASSGSMRCPSSDSARARSSMPGRWRIPWDGCGSSASATGMANASPSKHRPTPWRSWPIINPTTPTKERWLGLVWPASALPASWPMSARRSAPPYLGLSWPANWPLWNGSARAPGPVGRARRGGLGADWSPWRARRDVPGAV